MNMNTPEPTQPSPQLPIASNGVSAIPGQSSVPNTENNTLPNFEQFANIFLNNDKIDIDKELLNTITGNQPSTGTDIAGVQARSEATEASLSPAQSQALNINNTQIPDFLTDIDMKNIFGDDPNVLKEGTQEMVKLAANIYQKTLDTVGERVNQLIPKLLEKVTQHVMDKNKHQSQEEAMLNRYPYMREPSIAPLAKSAFKKSLETTAGNAEAAMAMTNAYMENIGKVARGGSPNSGAYVNNETSKSKTDWSAWL